MTSIYDMMGRYTSPSVRDDDPVEHVEKFFQVHVSRFQWPCSTFDNVVTVGNFF